MKSPTSCLSSASEMGEEEEGSHTLTRRRRQRGGVTTPKCKPQRGRSQRSTQNNNGRGQRTEEPQSKQQTWLRATMARRKASAATVLLAPWLVICCLCFQGVLGSRPDAVLCPLSEYIDDNDETVREFFECPGLEDPPNYRVCCEEKCCPLVDSVLQLDIKYAMIISLTVITLCVVSGFAIVICCFVSSCPMYDTCSGGWGKGEGGGPSSHPFMGGYIPSDMHPLTLNGSKENSLEKNHTFADGMGPVKVAEADHV